MKPNGRITGRFIRNPCSLSELAFMNVRNLIRVGTDKVLLLRLG